MHPLSKHTVTTRLTVFAVGLAGMLACGSDEPTTAPGAATADMQSSSTRITVSLAPRIDGFVENGNLAVDNSIVQTLRVPSFEDRGIIEFDLRKFSGPVLRATLRLPVYGSTGPYRFGWTSTVTGGTAGSRPTIGTGAPSLRRSHMPVNHRSFWMSPRRSRR